MKKINGHTFIERDYVGEIGLVGDTRLIRAACNRFLTSRGLPANEHGYNAPYGKGRVKPRGLSGHATGSQL